MSASVGQEQTQRTPAVSVRGLRKTYGEVEAVAGIDLEIRRGEVFALLGPNGAGKTTTVEILEGYRRRNGGDVTVLGVDPENGGRALRERIGIVLQESGMGLELTVREAIELYSAPYPHTLPVDEVMALVGLGDCRDALVRTLSGGQRRRLDLALAVAGDPELLFLDEPTTGFDPSARRRSWSLVENLRSLGKTILLTTHYMDEAQNLADRVAVMARGRIVAEGTPAMLAARANGAALVRFRLQEGVDRGAAAATPGRRQARLRGRARHLPHRRSHARADTALQLGERAGRGARGPDRDASVPRGRLPRADGREPNLSRPSDLALAWLWLKGRLRLMTRTPRATFFTFVFPLILLVLLDSLGGGDVSVPGGKIAYGQYITPAIAIFALTAATYSFVIFGVATAREQGTFKRVRGTPLPMRVFLGSWVVSTVLAALGSVALMLVVAVPAFGVDLRYELLPAAIVTLVLGGLTFTALGFAVASFVRRAETAPIVANLTLFPLLFISGVFYSVEGEPEWLQRIAQLFPLYHLVHAFTACFSPYTTGSGFSERDLWSLFAWGAIGTVVAVRLFSREATDEETGVAGSRPWRRAVAGRARS